MTASTHIFVSCVCHTYSQHLRFIYIILSSLLIISFYFSSISYEVILLFFHSIFFFFSSRRRHTRLVSDWSSDVCSSDLVFEAGSVLVGHGCAEEDARRG